MEEDNAGIEGTSDELGAVKNSCTQPAPMSDIGLQELKMNSTLPKKKVSASLFSFVSLLTTVSSTPKQAIK